jgi:hypothetical protein
MPKFCHPDFIGDKIYSNWNSYFGLRLDDNLKKVLDVETPNSRGFPADQIPPVGCHAGIRPAIQHCEKYE